MVYGAVCGSAYKIGTGFDFVARSMTTSSSEGSVPFMSSYCSEIGAWYGTEYKTLSDLGSYYVVLSGGAGGVINITDSTGLIVRASVTSSTGVTISPASFCEVSATSSGNGSVSVGGTAYGKYRLGGSNVTITATPSTGYKVKKMLVNGTNVGAVTSYTITNINQDYSVVVYFVPTSYTVTCNTPSGGTAAFTKNGTAATVPFTANVDDVIVCTATPNSDKMVQNFTLDGAIASGGSTGPQSFSFTIYEREDDATYNCTVTFSDRTAITDTVVGKSDGTTDDAIVTCGGSTVTRTAAGLFSGYVGNTYTATAATPTSFREYAGWKNANGEIVGSEASYSWTQGNSAVAITAAYVDKPLYTENFYVGTSTSDYGTGGTAYVAGCRAEITRPTGTTKDGKWLGGTRTVTATTTPTNWTFSGVYVSDTSASGGTVYYKANGASSVTFESACDANIYAIFANGEEVAPEDTDQGHSSIAAGTAADGIYIWENGSTNMTMRWKSKMYVASMPMTISTARVYADGYATSGTNDTKLKCLMFQSPDSTDSRVVETTAKSQDAYRMPMRRPEKYIELEVSAPHEVTQIAVATGMEALWQA